MTEKTDSVEEHSMQLEWEDILTHPFILPSATYDHPTTDSRSSTPALCLPLSIFTNISKTPRSCNVGTTRGGGIIQQKETPATWRQDENKTLDKKKKNSPQWQMAKRTEKKEPSRHHRRNVLQGLGLLLSIYILHSIQEWKRSQARSHNFRNSSLFCAPLRPALQSSPSRA